MLAFLFDAGTSIKKGCTDHERGFGKRFSKSIHSVWYRLFTKRVIKPRLYRSRMLT